MNISENNVVSLSYQLRVNATDGDIVETVDKERPLQFIYGLGQMLPKFEEHLKNLTAGSTFEFSLQPEEAYGMATEDAVIDIPVSAFMVDGELDSDLLVVDNVIPMQDKNGNRFNGLVLEVNDQNVTMDFNHPLAGDTLFFKGEVIDVREATAEELSHGHIHGAHDHHHDGGCDSCNSNCEDCE